MSFIKECGTCGHWVARADSGGHIGHCKCSRSPACGKNCWATNTCDFWKDYGGDGMKAQLVGEIKAIYRDLGHQHQGRPLEEFSEEQLRTHLQRLKTPSGPPLAEGGESAVV